MRILLDTQAFLWLGTDSPELTPRAKELFLDNQNDLFLSLASVWEMAIKASLGKLKFHKAFQTTLLDRLRENAIQQLNLEFRHVARIANLPFHNFDPFDRLLVSQAIEEKMAILSNDPAFDLYPVERLW